jgi:rhodanese-related sulfurtransferase
VAAAVAPRSDRARGSTTRSPQVVGDVDVRGIADEIAAEKDHVTPLDLAEWIRSCKEGLRVVDVRSPGDGEDAALPTAERIDLRALMTTPFASTDTVVVYSDESTHAAQAWVLLRALGYRQVFFLRGGRAAWESEVLHPTLADDASDDAQAHFARASSLSRYFGGIPRAGTGKKPTSLPHRRGC